MNDIWANGTLLNIASRIKFDDIIYAIKAVRAASSNMCKLFSSPLARRNFSDANEQRRKLLKRIFRFSAWANEWCRFSAVGERFSWLICVISAVIPHSQRNVNSFLLELWSLNYICIKSFVGKSSRANIFPIISILHFVPRTIKKRFGSAIQNALTEHFPLLRIKAMNGRKYARNSRNCFTQETELREEV